MDGSASRPSTHFDLTFASGRSALSREWQAAVGIGLKPVHFDGLLARRAPLDFLEAHAENFLVAGGPLHHYLGRLRESYALHLHGVGLSIGGEEPLDETHLDRIARLVERYQPAVFSEHLAWSGHGGVYLNDLLPLPYNRTTLARVCEHVDRVQTRLGRSMLIENPSSYVTFRGASMDEGTFMREITRRTGCGLLLDVNNVFVSATNQGLDPPKLLDALPLHRTGQIHLAGFACDTSADGAPLLIDDHGSPVDEAVWTLFDRALATIGPRPTMIERDNDVPALDVLIGEAVRARSRLLCCETVDA